ncbi:hypothetical protein [Thermoflexus sp.]|uniref:hypothetical protein n=1 Tax=Thermoflexus sp. TaxID=1969742 RepID=UPI0025CFEBEF|nr:hypothetical protein [Thermoflexus sp.]MCS6964832.1 hypothetical protein [Thermoflexus sp.]MCS7350351.1 hypothetical protein [Thermoflexus sp.]MDW8179802.1 hypothetical protein [Anaerolineae bacterium]MDW8183708.1 hypothetical protein [Anaerolineae bacterium]
MDRAPYSRLEKWTGPVLALLIGGLLYFPWVSRRYDPNGLIEAAALEQGRLFSPHHLLFRPLGWISYHILESLGLGERSIFAFQSLSALSGALGLGLYFLLMRRIGLSNKSAMAFTLALGTSWSYWVFSTDASYIVPATTAAIGFLLAYYQEPLTLRRAIIAAILSALAALLWQAYGVLLLLWLLRLIASRGASGQKTFQSLLVGFGMALAIIAVIYAGVSIHEIGAVDPYRMIEWGFTYKTRLPIWGRLDPERVLAWLQSAVASWIPLSEGLGWRAMLRGEGYDPWGILCGLAVCITLPQMALKLLSRIWNSTWWPVRSIAVGVGALALFILWWDPYEPKWFVALQAPLILLLAHVWSGQPNSKIATGLMLLSLTIVGMANFHKSIAPRRWGPHPLQERARCVAQHMQPEDIFLATDWMWAEYLSYFHQRAVLSLLDLAARYRNKLHVAQHIRQKILEVQQRSGRIYMVDPSSYPSDYFHWIKSATGFDREDLESLRGSYVFTCDGLRFFEALTP